VNETKTEPRAWRRGAAADRPAHLPTVPNDCRCESVDAEPGAGWALVGTHQDLLGGYEAGSLLIAESERMADCGPSSIAPNDAESGRVASRLVSRGASDQIYHPWGNPLSRERDGLAR